MKGPKIQYEPEELAWIESRKDWSRRDLHRAFCNFWLRKDVSFDNFKSLCTRKGWKTGRTGCFPKGSIPPNKGKKGCHAPGSEKGWFKKGQRPANKQHVGYETIDRDGYVLICVDRPNPWSGHRTHMRHKHRELWEQANGPVPGGHVLKCIDGDKTNCAPSNWEPVPKALMPRLAGRWSQPYDAAESEVKPVLMAIAKLEHAAREVKRAKA